MFYEILAERSPVWFTIYSTIVGPRPEEEQGLRLRLRLPHTVYVYGEPLRREDLVVAGAQFEPDSSAVTVRVDNTSERLGRVRWVEARSAEQGSEAAGFPLLPTSGRVVRIPWTRDEPPVTVTLHLDDFEIRVPIRPAGRRGPM